MRERRIKNGVEWISTQGVKVTLSKYAPESTLFQYEYIKEWNQNGRHRITMQWDPRGYYNLYIHHSHRTDTHCMAYHLTILPHPEREVDLLYPPFKRCTLYQRHNDAYPSGTGPWETRFRHNVTFCAIHWLVKWRLRKRRRLVALLLTTLLLPPVLLQFIPL